MEERTIFQPSVVGSVKPGTRLNGVYEIEALTAHGGMGEVYRGFNIQTHDVVAIKMILPELSNSPEVLELFRREASILHNLTHEAIVRYFVFSVDPEIRRAYLAMEFVDGPSLTNRLASGPLPLAEVRILQRRIAHALEAAHRLGIIHRDVSPDNIILPEGDVRKAKIIDFGIARSLSVGQRTIIGGGFAGKYNYVSPEQLGLMGADVTFKSDIYSFGLVLAEAARGRALDMNGSQAEIIEKRRAVPDISDVDRSIRPLLQAMLQPSPEKRPISMTAVAEWGEKLEGRRARRSHDAEAPESAARASGSMPAIVAAIVAIVSLGGAGYVFRDDLAQWVRPVSAPSEPAAKVPTIAPPPPTEAAQPSSQTANENPKLPPLGPLGSPGTPVTQAPTIPQAPTEQEAAKAPPSETPGSPAEPAPAPAPPPQSHHVPNSNDLADAAPPRAQQSLVELAPAAVGTPYRADLPIFTDPGGKGLRLAAESLPEGMTFTDLGDGRGAIEGTPTQAGPTRMRVVATDHNGRTADMTATIVVTDRTPPLSSGKPVSPAQPEQGAPPPASVAPHPAAVPRTQPEQAAPAPQKEARLEGPADRARLFVASYNGGDCFLIKPLPGGGAPAYLGVGDKLGPFQRFEEAFKREIGVDPQLSLRQITTLECPAIELLRPSIDAASEIPRIDLADYAVGPHQPLAGKIANLGGRRAVLLLVDNDGVAYRLETESQAGGEAATFSVPLTPDAGSAKQLQVLLAIVSTKPIPALDSFRSGPLQAIAPALLKEARNGAASVGAEFFTFAK